MNPPSNFIIVDDDKLVCMFCSMVLKKFFNNATVKTFEDPQTGLEFIKLGQFLQDAEARTVLFLDINMPSMNGWEFLENFENLDEEIKNSIQIYILSSSVDERDKERAANNKYVKAFWVKPLTKEMLQSAHT